ncbi:MAG: hypothetical protein AAF340_06425 [Pseudomonadota bacterium]
MTRTLFLFEDGTALAGGIEADAKGDRVDLPFLSENARVSAARAALAKDDWAAAEAIAERRVVSSSDEDLIQVTFVAPPDWERFGAVLWNPDTGTAHAVFTGATMLVDGVAVECCVGRPFEDDAARRDCAAWCIRNGLEDVALKVSRTPVGGNGPYCTWPDGDIEATEARQETSRQAKETSHEPIATEVSFDQPDLPDDMPDAADAKVVSLFGKAICPPDL